MGRKHGLHEKRGSCRIKVNMALTMIHSVSLEEEQKKIDEQRKCIICFKARKHRIWEWTTKRRTRARQFYPERTQKFDCFYRWCHNSCLVEWVKANGRLILLFQCPQCRAIGCDSEEMAEFLEGVV